jgi:NADH:ubiquinone oxidoreductase subunit 6 (subunit J)
MDLTINWHSFFFLLLALAACGFAVAVVVSANIVRMAFYLVMSLGAVSGLFFLAGADFLGIMQLMIYVGGTLVLLIFGVMLTAGGPRPAMKISRGQWLLSAIAAAALLAVLLEAAGKVADWRHGRPTPEAAATTGSIGLGLIGIRSDQPDQPDESRRAGMAGYLLPFEIISVHLVVVLVGAAYLARARRRRE